MSLLNKIHDLFFGKKKQIKYSDDNFVRSSMVYSDGYGDNIMILVSFTDQYLSEACELISATECMTKYISTFYDKNTTSADDSDDTDTDEYIHMNYLLLAGKSSDYIKTYQQIEGLDNTLLLEIGADLVNNVDNSLLSSLQNDNVLTKISDNTVLRQRVALTHKTPDYTGIYYRDDHALIMRSLPSEFTSRDIVPMLKVYGENIHTSKYLTSVIKDLVDDENYSELFEGLTTDNNPDTLRSFLLPLYMQETLRQDDVISGAITVTDVDDIFKEKYDRFSSVAGSNVEYISIDEPVSEDDPEYNVVNDLLQEEAE